MEKFPDSILLICSSLFKTQDDNLIGVRTVTRKALHVLNGQRQVPIQEAVHILDNQELVICSDRITYVSLAQGQALWSETDRSKQKDLITVYGTKIKNTTPYHWNSTSIVFLLTQLSRSTKRTKKQTAIATIIKKRKTNPKQLLNLNPSGPTDIN